MNYAQENAILNEAGRALSEFRAHKKRLTTEQRKNVIDKHFNVIKALGISRVKFLKFISNVKNNC